MPGFEEGAGTQDEALLSACTAASGEERGRLANELFSHHYEQVARWCYRFTGDREAAADLAQDVFLKAFRHLDSFRGTARFSTWLYSIARNEWITRAQRERRKGAVETADALVDLPAPGDIPSTAAERTSQRRWVHQFLLDTLDDTERAVFTLHFGDDMPLEDVTRLLRLDNPSGAKAFVVAAKRKLARAISKLRAQGSMP